MSDISLIGCRISIISKAKIRYEGYLHSVDCDTPDEPVITLSKVWSFGTEDRPCERPVAPRNEEYKQVVFRGRDLEDVRLVQSSVFLNQDSAIVSAAPGSAVPQTSSTEKNRNDTRDTDRPPFPIGPNSNLQSLSASQSVHFDILNQNPVGGSPSAPQPTSLRPGPIGTFQSERSQATDNRGPRPFGDGRSDVDTGITGVPKIGRSAAPDPFYDSTKSRTVVGSSSHPDSAQQWQNRPNYREEPSGLHSRSSGAANDQHSKRRPGYSHWSANQRVFRHSPMGANRRGSRGGYYGWSRPHTDMSSAISLATFTGEYDYEKANAELAAELEKISIAEPKSNSSLDGDGKGDESGGSLAGDDTSQDKAKSFFDTFSSELIDKANGMVSHRMNRRDERLLNSTTFGMVPSHYPRRGSSGGAGGYYRRSGGSYGGYTYGQRRPVGFSRQYGSNPRGSFNNPGTALSAASNSH